MCASCQRLAVVLVLIGLGSVPGVLAVTGFQPPVGPIATVVTPSSAQPQIHNGFRIDRSVQGDSIEYKVTRPSPLAIYVFERTRPLSATSSFGVEAAFVGDHGLLFKVVDADTVKVRTTVVFLNLLQPFPTEQNLYSREDRVGDSPNAQFFQNGDGSCLFSPVTKATAGAPNAFELSVVRMDTGALLCTLAPQELRTGDSLSAEILDAVAPAGSDTLRIRHKSQSSVITEQRCPLPVAPAPAQTSRVSVATGGVEGGGSSAIPKISGDGRFVAFLSTATLVANDTNGNTDIFVNDRVTGDTTRVSVTSNGSEANLQSTFPAISGDGRFVAFFSVATNLVANDTNGVEDVFVHDRTTRETTRVSVGSGGIQADIGGRLPAISGDGRFVAFESAAFNLVANDTNRLRDIFVRDRATGTTTRVSVGANGAQAIGGDSTFPVISGDGRRVAFLSLATNLVANDTNGRQDVFVRDTASGSTTRVSVGQNGVQANDSSFDAAISRDGRFVAFASDATNLVANDTNGRDVFVRDLTLNTTTRVSVTADGVQGNGASTSPALSANGKLVAFQSFANNLIANDANGTQDILQRDDATKSFSSVSVTSVEVQANGFNNTPTSSDDGRFVAFSSDATNLVANDRNANRDIFVRDRGEQSTGDFDLAPSDPTVAAHERLSYAFTWTVPAPRIWRELQFLRLRISDAESTALSLLWDETGNRIRLLDSATDQYGPAFGPGSPQRLQTPLATIYLEDTSVVGSGPTGSSVTLHLSLSFKSQAAGRTFSVDVTATDDQGNADAFTRAGTLTVTRDRAGEDGDEEHD